MRPTPGPRNRWPWYALGGCLAVLCCAAWFVHSRTDSSAVALPHAPTQREAAPESERIERPPAAEPAIVTPERTGRRELDVDHDGRIEVEILVRVQESETPLAGCAVTYFERDEHPRLMQDAQLGGLDMKQLQRLGKQTVADSLGRVRLRCEPEKRLIVLATSQEHWGIDGLDVEAAPPAQQFVLECKPLSTLRCQVVDSAGQPRAGIQVLLQQVTATLPDPPQIATTREGDGIAFEQVLSIAVHS